MVKSRCIDKEALMFLDDLSLKGKVAIVTGAGRGIGKTIALAFAEAGADIVAVSRTKEEIESTCREVRKMGRQAIAITADVTNWEQVKSMADKAYAHFKHIDILVNNAGTAAFKPLVSTHSLRSGQ